MFIVDSNFCTLKTLLNKLNMKNIKISIMSNVDKKIDEFKHKISIYFR